jgi:hypothetical protein
VVRALVIHGMGTHTETFADKFLDSLALRLRIKRDGPCEVMDEFKTSYGSVSTVRRCTYRGGGSTRVLLAYSLTWSRITEAFEDSILRSDWEVHGRERVRLNRDLKEELIDKRFSDAVLYAGSFAPTLRTTVKRALCIMVLGHRPETGDCAFRRYYQRRDREVSDVFVISHSLGSMMVMETIGELIRAPDALREQGLSVPEETSDASRAASELLREIRTFSMLANQLPLLYLARIPAEKPTGRKGDLEMFGQEACNPNKVRPIAIVAYSDPNDLLSFPLSPGWGLRLGCETDKLRFINIPVANDTSALFGAVADPDNAHTGYWNNRTIFRFIANGHH